MNCWKSINLSREYGYHRIVLISTLMAFITFIMLYLPFSMIFSSVNLKENGIHYFILGIFILSPIHKLLHGLPLWLTGRKVGIKVCKIGGIPTIHLTYRESIPRPLFIMAVTFPALIITSTMVIASFSFPAYMHYFVMMASIHIGFCVTDFIYLIQSMRAPKKCFVKDFDGGYDILIDNGLM